MGARQPSTRAGRLDFRPSPLYSRPLHAVPRSFRQLLCEGAKPKGSSVMAETTAAKKRLREYETIFLVKPDLTDDNVDKIKDRLRGIVDREGGKVIRFTIWGK